MADVATTPANGDKKRPEKSEKPEKPEKSEKHEKPEKPDQHLFDERVAKAEKEYQDAMTRYNAIKAKIEIAQPNKNKEQQTPTQKRRQELISQANEIRNKQGAGKTARSSKLDQIKRLDEQMRSRIAEQKTARGKVAFKSAEELDHEIERLEKQVNGGLMKLVDEKKALADISNLRKQRKSFAQFDNGQKGIDELKAKIKEIKDSMENPEARALSDEYTKIQTELDSIKAEQDEVFKNLNSLRDERSKLQAEQQEKFQAVRKIKDEYYAQKKAAAAYERESRDRYREKQRLERERFDKEKKKERAQRLLEEASDPAYYDEIRRANNLLNFFEPSSTPAEKAPLLADKGLGAQADRKVDDSGLKGTKLVRKEDRDDEYFSAAKKGKKGGKKSGPTEKGFNVPPSVISDLASIGIDPPMGQADVPAVVEKVKAKLSNWKSDQEAQTQRNIEKAKKEIEKIEAEEATEKSNGADDEKKVDAVTKDLKDASLETKE